MKGVTNFRDLGGIATADGRRIRPGMLLRAAAPAYAAKAEMEAMAARGVRLICDFRSDGERPNDPSVWARELGIDYFAPNSGRAVGDPLTALMRATVSTEQTHALLHDVYRNLPYAQEHSFRQLFAWIVKGQAPVLYHCASGKDRTGVFSALLMQLLGVPRAAIDTDFERSNEAVEAITADFKQQPRLEPIWTSPFEVWSPLLYTHRAWLDTMFETLAAKHGSVDGYLQDLLDVGPNEQEALRELLLEPATA